MTECYCLTYGQRVFTRLRFIHTLRFRLILGRILGALINRGKESRQSVIGRRARGSRRRFFRKVFKPGLGNRRRRQNDRCNDSLRDQEHEQQWCAILLEKD